MNKLVQWVLNIVAGFFFFFLFLVLFFPLESLARHFLSQVEARTNGAYRVTVGEMDPNVLFKSVFRNFQVYKVEKGEAWLIADIPEMRLGISYLTLLGGNMKASFIARGKKGDMEGSVVISKNEYQLDSELNDFPLGQLPYLADILKVPLEGKVKGVVNINLYPRQLNKNRGKIDLKLAEFKIAPSRITPYPGLDLDLPATMLSGVKGGVLKASMEKGRLTVEKFAFPGEDVIVDLRGSVQLSPRFSLSRLDLQGSFKLSDKLAQAIPMIVVIEKQKGEDGSYPITLGGRFNRPQLAIGTFEVL